MNEPASNEVLSCRLSTPELQKRKQTIIADLKALIISKRELANGMEYSFNAGDTTIDVVADFIKTERQCCEFFSFSMHVEQTTLTLAITGSRGSKNLLDDLFQ